MTTSPTCTVQFYSDRKQLINASIREGNDHSTIVEFPFSFLTDGPYRIAAPNVEVVANLVGATEDKQATTFTAEVRFDCQGIEIGKLLKDGDAVKVIDAISGASTDMQVNTVHGDALYMAYRWPLAKAKAKALLTIGYDAKHAKRVYLHDFSMIRDVDGKCMFEMDLRPVPGLYRRLADGIEAFFFRLAAWRAKKPNGKEGSWPKRISAILFLAAVIVAIWGVGPDAYRWLSGVAGGLLAPSASSAKPEDPNAYGCVPATDWTVREFFWQENSKKVVGKIAPYKDGTLGIYCKTPAPYDAKSKTSDVTGCEICMPMKYSKAGKYPLTPDFLKRMFGQSDPSCYYEPALPFRPSQKTLNDALRIDMECKEFSFNPAGCFDYSKCMGIVPMYYTDK